MTRNVETLLAQIAAMERRSAEQEATIARLLEKGQEREERYLGLLERNKELERRVERHHLTGLYNKTAFETKVTEFITQIERFRAHPEPKRKSDAGGAPYGVFAFLDLDGFKFVNDIIGKVAGDEVLIRIAQFLKYRFKHDPRDIVGHLGGDEFALLLSGIDIETARMIIERDVRTAIRGVKPSEVDMVQFEQRMKRNYIVDASYGLVAVDNPGLNFASLMNLAENKMPKLRGRREDFLSK